MAASANSKMAELNEKFLTCEVCAESYKRPKMLLCGHTFCQECLENWAKANQGKELTCPNCRQPWQVPVGGVEKLPTNYHLKAMIDDLVESEEAKKTENGEKMCDFCESKGATSACLECSQSFCEDCTKGHKRIKSNAEHKVVSLEDYRANYEKQPAKLKTNECDRHPGIQLEFYCQTCSVPICMKCTIVDHRVPQHKHVYLSEAVREGRVTINKSVKEVQTRLNYYNEKEANIRKVKEDLTKNKDKTALEIDMHTEKLVKKIRESGKEMKRKTDEIYEAKAKVLDSQLSRMELAKGQVKSCIDFSMSLVELGTDARMMSVYKQTQEMFRSLLSEKIQVEPQVDYHLQYSANPAFANGQLGSVVDSKAVAHQSVVKQKQPYAMLKNKALFQLVTNDLQGNEVGKGGAEVTAEVTTKKGERVASEVKDNDNGTYDITFTPTIPSTHWLSVSLLNQPVKDSPINVNCPPLQSTKVIGCQGKGPGQYNRLSGVAVSKVSDIYIADYDNCRIQVFDSHGEYKRNFTVDRAGKRVQPWGVACTREEHLLITDYEGKRVCVCDTNGKLLRQFGIGEIKDPTGVAVGSDGRIHVTDFVGHCVKTFTPEGVLVRTIGGQQGHKPGQLYGPRSVAINSRDQIIVNDMGNHRVQVFGSSGAFLFACGRQGEGEGELQWPRGVAVDQHDNIIVCDCDNNRTVMFSPEGAYMGCLDYPNKLHYPVEITTIPGDPLKFIMVRANPNQLEIMEIK